MAKKSQLAVPTHIGFIMDGNGRWARRRGLPRNAGHAMGRESTLKVLDRCAEIGVKYVTLYAFSTENWSRPKQEIDYIYTLIREVLQKYQIDFVNKGYKLIMLGDLTKFPKDLIDAAKECEKQTKDCNNLVVGICANYGGRAEIVRAVNDIIKAKVSKVDEQTFKNYLYTTAFPDPDLIVRTSGEQRLSGFLLYQASYSEFYFPKVFWPSMNAKWVDKCVKVYKKRNRRFGSVSK